MSHPRRPSVRPSLIAAFRLPSPLPLYVGLTLDIWSQFQERYHVRTVAEFYLSTEGNVGLFNCFDRPGAVGFVPRAFDPLYPANIVRADPANKDVPLRGADGRCEHCSVDEVGLLVSLIDERRADRR